MNANLFFVLFFFEEKNKHIVQYNTELTTNLASAQLALDFMAVFTFLVYLETSFEANGPSGVRTIWLF